MAYTSNKIWLLLEFGVPTYYVGGDKVICLLVCLRINVQPSKSKSVSRIMHGCLLNLQVLEHIRWLVTHNKKDKLNFTSTQIGKILIFKSWQDKQDDKVILKIV